MQVLVVGDLGDNDPGHVGDALVDLGARLRPLDRDALPVWAETGGADLLLLLGSARSVIDPAQSDPVARETALIRDAVRTGAPVLGICYGSQILATALGGSVAVAPQVELGWMSHDSVDDALCPPGPWLQFHGDTFTMPPGARLLGSSPAGPQAMAWEGASATGACVRALGWQFHPEVTPAVLDVWLRVDSAFVAEHGDRDAILADTRRLGARAERAARELTGRAVQWLDVPGRGEVAS